MCVCVCVRVSNHKHAVIYKLEGSTLCTFPRNSMMYDTGTHIYGTYYMNSYSSIYIKVETTINYTFLLVVSEGFHLQNHLNLFPCVYSFVLFPLILIVTDIVP